MREQGRLTEWNDERGFGFITPLVGGPKVFVHISEFPRGLRRPMATDLVTYSATRDDRNRLRAQQVAFLAPTHARHEDERPRLGLFEIAVPAVFMLVLSSLTVTETIPSAVFGFYVFVSVVAFVMYWQDKVAAVQGQWRASEAALLGVAVLGGWPGGFIARHIFRHKTRKQPFRTLFWIAVCMNCALLAFIVAASSQTPG